MIIQPHIEEKGKIKTVTAWVDCGKCNCMHRILPGEITPYWWCQDERCQLKEGQEIEVKYIEEEIINAG